jgi:hypothetical protein
MGTGLICWSEGLFVDDICRLFAEIQQLSDRLIAMNIVKARRILEKFLPWVDDIKRIS